MPLRLPLNDLGVEVDKKTLTYDESRLSQINERLTSF